MGCAGPVRGLELFAWVHVISIPPAEVRRRINRGNALRSNTLLLLELNDMDELTGSSSLSGGGQGGSHRPKRPRDYGTSLWAQTLEHIAQCREKGDPDELSETEFQTRFRFSYDHFCELIKLLQAKDYDNKGKRDLLVSDTE